MTRPFNNRTDWQLLAQTVRHPFLFPCRYVLPCRSVPKWLLTGLLGISLLFVLGHRTLIQSLVSIDDSLADRVVMIDPL